MKNSHERKAEFAYKMNSLRKPNPRAVKRSARITPNIKWLVIYIFIVSIISKKPFSHFIFI